jgi:antitoxin PrlF
MQSAVTSKGQITIPKEARDRMKIGPGDKMKFFFDAHGHLMMMPVVPISRARGIVKYSGPTITIEQMDDAVSKGVVERYRRAVSGR